MSSELQAHYEALGLTPDADERAVKRAYFQRVKECTPEENPEEFQRIRAAYEVLTHLGEEEDTDVEMPEDPLAAELYAEGMMWLSRENGKKAMALADEMIETFGDWEAFYCLLSSGASLCGSTGRRVKALEKLVELKPEKRAYRRDLATAYYDRGWQNKALTAFRAIYDEGERDLDFLLCFAACCQNREESEMAIRLYREVYDQAMENQADNLILLMGTLGELGIIIIGTLWLDDSFKDMVRRFYREGLLYLEEDTELEFCLLASQLLHCHVDAGDYRVAYLTDCVSLILDRITDDELRFSMQTVLETCSSAVMLADERLPRDLVNLCDLANLDVDPEVRPFVVLELKLFLLEQWPELLEKIAIVEQEYPEHFEPIRAWAEQLRGVEDIERLRSRMIRDYDRKSKRFEGAGYFDAYPNRRPRLETVVWNSEEDGVRRVGRKIGRNDPCPCGSGKKYKKCCGKDA